MNREAGGAKKRDKLDRLMMKIMKDMQLFYLVIRVLILSACMYECGR